MMRSLTAVRCAIALVFPVLATAFADITGVVKDSASGAALSGVTVYVKESPSLKTTSDLQGRFTIQETMHISHPGTYPAPIGIRMSAGGRLSVSGPAGIVRITMLDVKGAAVWKKESAGDGPEPPRLSLPRLAHGLYVLDISIGESRLRCKTIYSAAGYSNFFVFEQRGSALHPHASGRTLVVTLVFEKAEYLTKELIYSGAGQVEIRLARQPVPSTGGSGGLTFASSGKAGNYSYGKKKVGIVEVKVFEFSDNKPRQLAFFLHGDGAGTYHADEGRLLVFATWANKNGILFVAALAPNGHAWWRAPEDNGAGAEIVDREGKNADGLDSVIKVLGRAYNLYTRNVLYCGASGGSTFLSRLYLSRYGDRHPGALVMNGGGGSTLLKWDWDYQVDSLRNRNWLLFNYGSGDFLKPYIEGGIGAYRKLNFAVDSLQHPGEGHCTPGIKIEENTIKFWEKHLVRGIPAARAPDAPAPSFDYEKERAAWVEGSKRYVKAMERFIP